MRPKYPPAGVVAKKNQDARRAIAEVSAESVEEAVTSPKGKDYAKAKAASLLLAGVPIKEVARRLGVSRETIHRWKSNDKLFSATVARKDVMDIASNEAKELLASQRELRDKVRKDVVKLKLMGACVDAVDVILEIMRNSMDDKVRLMAAKEVLDRGGFQKTAQIEVHHTQNPAEEVMLAEAFQVLGVDPEMSKYALPADGGVDGQRDYYAGSREYEEVLEPAGEESSPSQAECEQAVGHGGPIEPGSDSENQSG